MIFGNKTYSGLALQGNHILVATVQKRGGSVKVLHLDSYELAENVSVATETKPVQTAAANISSSTAKVAEDDVFGLEKQSSPQGNEKDNINFEELEARAGQQSDLSSLDMVSESEGQQQSNEAVMYNILMDIDSKSVQLGLNIPAGEAIYQIITDTNFSEVKEKDLVEDLEGKLETIYDQPPSSDYYAYQVREDGSLILASIGRPTPLVGITDEAHNIYNGKLEIRTVYPDEVALVGLLRANYALDEQQYTALIQFGPTQCRIVFMQGKAVFNVLPIINQGAGDTNFLDTVFSKLLFQLDTGKIDHLDQIIIADNTLGDEAPQFFRQHFPDSEVEDFAFDSGVIDIGKYEPATVESFTSAIAAAWAATGQAEDRLPALSFLPDYVRERQKIFKLQWHGLLLLFLIFLSIPTINYFYQRNNDEITSLSTRLELTQSRIQQVQPIVDQTNRISQNLSLLTAKLSLLDSLSAGSKTWSTRLDDLDNGMHQIPNSWFTSFSNMQSGNLIQGYTLYRNRVPAIVDLFAEATLLNVSIEERRDKQMYKFSIAVRKFAKDSTAYSPEKPQRINQLLNH